VYALDMTFESILASFAPPVVGFMSQHLYGFKPEGSSPDQDRENAASLAKALYTAISIPMVICSSMYTFMYRTYPRDRERARMHCLIRSELDHIELGSTLDCDDDGRFEYFDSENDGDKLEGIDVGYGPEEYADAGTKKLLANRDL
jgi:hypothetical protein